MCENGHCPLGDDSQSNEVARFLGLPERKAHLLPCVLQYSGRLEETAMKLGMGGVMKGCFAKDRIPRTPPGETAAYIVNMQGEEEGDKKGTHWVALVQFPHSSFYFDSMAVDPPKEVVRASRKPCVVNYQPVQDYNSCQCGYFCLYFLYHLLIAKLPVDAVLAHFSERMSDNDAILNRFFCEHTACIVNAHGVIQHHESHNPHRRVTLGSGAFGIFAPQSDSPSYQQSYSHQPQQPQQNLFLRPRLEPFIRSHR